MIELPAELIDGLQIRAITPVAGGDIARAYRLETAEGLLFLKTHPRPTPHLFQREARGLAALRAAAPAEVRVPEVLRSSSHGLLLEWIDTGQPNARTDVELGVGLATLHRAGQEHLFGGLAGDDAGYLGSVEVDLAPASSWVEFFFERRVRPLVQRCVRENQLPPTALSLLDAAQQRAEQLCGPEEPAALVHGDLWAGNRMADSSGRNWLIDPAVHYAHREIDLAMMRLFGGFSDATFLAYHEAYPLAEGWGERISWYQLPPLLVHAILFGGGYGASALSVLRAAAHG